jgi:putative transposase
MDSWKRLRKQLGVRCKQVRRFTVTTEPNHRLSLADNLLV